MSKPAEKRERSGRLSDDDVVRLSEQVAGLTAAGLPLASGLRATAEEMSPGRLRSALFALADRMDRGASLEEAVAAQGHRLPAHLSGLVLIASRTGRISQVLGRFVAFTNVGIELRRRLRISLAYPVFAVLLSTAVLLFVSNAFVGTYATILRDFGVTVPAVTRFLIALSNLFEGGWKFVVALLVFVALSFLVLNASTRRGLLSGLPIIGAVWRNSSLAEFCHLLALLLECDVPLPEALRLTADGVNDATLDGACVAMSVDVSGGMTLSQAISRRRVFPAGLTRLLSWAEGHQSLPESLHTAGEMFEGRAQDQAGFAGTVFMVVAVIAMLIGVFTVVVGLFLPLFTLISRLAG